MDGVVLATDPAPLPVKLVVACLAGLLPAEGLRNKVLAAEYRMALPDERLLVAELKRTQRLLETRKIASPERDT